MNTFNKLTSTVKAAADQAVDAGELPQRCCSELRLRLRLLRTLTDSASH